MSIEIRKLLSNETELIKQLSEQLHRDHWLEEGYSLEQSFAMVQSRCSSNKHGFPFIIIALDGDKVIGRSGLIVNDTMLRQDIYPLLMPVHVEKEYGGRGIAKLIMTELLAEADKIFDVIFVLTILDKFYESYGFVFVENTISAINNLGTPVKHRLYQRSL